MIISKPAKRFISTKWVGWVKLPTGIKSCFKSEIEFTDGDIQIVYYLQPAAEPNKIQFSEPYKFDTQKPYLDYENA